MHQAALVTGASERLGFEMARHMAKRGYDIVLHYNRSKDGALESASVIRRMGVECSIIQSDLCEIRKAEKLMSRAARKMPHLSVLVNNASVFEASNVVGTSESLLRRHMALNFEAPFLLIASFARNLGEGVIVNMLDERISRNSPSHAAYSISKKALKDLTLICAGELAPNIRVCGIAPGYILPPKSGSQDEKKILSKTPLGRKGSVSDINHALDYILDADHVTGQILYVDGGRHI